VEEEIGGGDPLKVLIPGNIGLAKGRDLIKQIKQADVHGLIEFHLLGKCSSDLQPWIVHHGPYKREQFGTLVASIRPHIAAVLSIWPETYCHTLTESWACGLPVLGIALGAVAERISRHGGGWLVEADADAIRTSLLAIRENRGERREKVRQVLEWQKGYGRENTTLKMSESYLALYQSVLSESRALRCARRKRIGFVMKGRFPAVPPTAYVRLVDWKGWFERKYGGPVDFLHWSALLRSELAGYSTIVVQRNAIPANRVGPAIEAIKRNGVHLVFEMDDNLFDVPAEVDTDGTYAMYRESLRQLCECADEVHVTNKTLGDICGRYNKEILVRPNRLSVSRWCGPPDAASGVAPATAPRNRIDILYFGSATHTADLEFAIAAVRLACARGARIALHVVGIPKTREAEDGIVFRHAPPSSRYDRFVPWLRNFAADFDAGIAPLVNRQFAGTKSYVKALEYAAMGLPSICSDGLPYSRLPSEGLVGVIKLVTNDVDAWAQALCDLPNLEPARRREISNLASDFWIEE
jgi:glycosyltransferase involved in cell wall biosynthesis